MTIIEIDKDEVQQRPVPSVWRDIFIKVVRSFVVGDYQLNAGIKTVLPVSKETAAQISDYIEDYGEQLIELPEETWNTSVCLWMGDHWDVLVDLWTEAEGRSDLVLSAQVMESDQGYRVQIYMVYVP
ncbi:DUF7668 domain-containing protein [Aestuariirhabdus haliotis]|uniref:DUF7668 domain-containing protein n=1 Tax=Aestuariirhabdus haliotis TaxID=2918751 RepID=UPI0020C06494|nr:hypothetical protein [Aestuariirhabdus haliotis]MCL6418119.1 hypothetical protein [Aestuariirhabdus haliotis]